MHFVRTEDLKTGMRLARPVYNKKSILLFDRNSLLSLQAIAVSYTHLTLPTIA